MAGEHVKGVIDLTFLDIQDESQVTISLVEKNPINTLSLSTSPGKTALRTNNNASNNLLGSSSSTRKSEYEEIKALRFSNNLIHDMSIIINPILQTLDPSLIQWLDLSFNQITSISDVVSSTLPNLSTFYLHANKITKLSDIKRLSSFKNMKALTLYGNPVEEKKHYKKYSLYHHPQLMHFDSSIITKQDRQQVEIWSQTYRKMLNPETEE